MDQSPAKRTEEDSLVADPSENNSGNRVVLSLAWDDLEVGKLIGSGSFAFVYQIKPLSPALLDQGASLVEEDEYYENADLSSHTFCSERSLPVHENERFVLKTLNQELVDNQNASERKVKCAIEGLQFEADLLSKLPRHENVIILVGLSSISVQEPTQGFLILERLIETLDMRLKRWKNRKMIEKKGRSLLDRFARQAGDPEQRSRIAHIGLGIAKAMTFLHSHSVLYRDLKPDNIGFDCHGRVKVFDFGLARLLDRREDKDGERRRLTFQVGSLRYMSPECAKGEEYSFSTDVHSFAVLLWEVITLETAFSKVRNAHQLSKMVFFGHQRPSLKLVQSREIRKLLQASWDPKPELRPTFTPIVSHLCSQVNNVKNN